MGSSSRGSSDWQPPAQQGPPISVLNPGQGAPNPQYVNFLPDNNSPATGLTGAMIAALNGQAAPPAAAATAAASPAATPGGVTMQDVRNYVQGREQLARLMAANPGYGSSYGGGGGGGGYGTSGRGW